MAEKMDARLDAGDLLEQGVISPVDISRKVPYAQWGLVADQDIRIGRNPVDMLFVCTCQVIAYKHGHSVEVQTFYCHARVAEIMHMLRQPFQLGLVKAIVMISGDEYFVRMREGSQPFDKIKGFFLRARHGEVPGVDKHVCIG